MSRKLYTLITGASEGFGKALAIECASRKMNLILVALPESCLHTLANTIKQKYNVDVIVIEKDLSIEENCKMVFSQVEEMQIAVNMLINNVGLGSTMLFSEGSIAFYEKQVKLNVMATTVLTHLFLDMLRKNGPSNILYVGSLCSFFFLMKKQVYGATKSYIYFFSKSLRRELKADHINVSVICPGPMSTNASVILTTKGSNWITRMSEMNPEKVAPIAINGLLKHKEVIIPGMLNRFFLLMDKLLPKVFKTFMTNYQMKNLKSITAMTINQ